MEYAAFQILSSKDATVAGFKDTYDFYIFPIVNPDGFAFTQKSDRLWRKNRQTTPSASCVGRDINRNWPSHWDQREGNDPNLRGIDLFTLLTAEKVLPQTHVTKITKVRVQEMV